MIFECIKEGFALTNKNLQVTVIRVVAAIISLIALVFCFAIPLIGAILYLGLDIASAQDLWPILQGDPSTFIARYLGIITLFGISIICYLTFVSVLFIYVLGGSVGVLRNAAANLNYTFSLSSFFREAGQNYGRLCRMITLVGIALLALLIALLIISVIIMAVVNFISGSIAFLAMYLKSFLVVALIIIGAITFIASFVFSAYAVVICVIERVGAVDSIKKTVSFLIDRPVALLYCIFLFAGAVVLNVLLFTVRVPVGFVPLLGPLFSFVLSIMSVLVQSYISVAVWASLIIYYMKCMNYPAYSNEVCALKHE